MVKFGAYRPISIFVGYRLYALCRHDTDRRVIRATNMQLVQAAVQKDDFPMKAPLL